MTIHLRAENWSSLGDDTFWCWALREFPGAVRAGRLVGVGDQVLHYGLLGAPAIDADRSVALLWEQHTEMEREVAQICNKSWSTQIRLLSAAAQSCKRRTVATDVLVDDFAQYGKVDVLPIGVDTDLWKPVSSSTERNNLRDSYHIPHGAEVGFWGGHGHPMKGWKLLQRYARSRPNVYWAIVFKRKQDRIPYDLRGVSVAGVAQSEVAKLMQMCDFALFTSFLRPYSMMEWEAMSCNLPVINIGHAQREFSPGKEPRKTVFDRGWDRYTAKKTWLEYLGVG